MTKKEQKEMREAISIIGEGKCALAPYSYYWPLFYGCLNTYPFGEHLYLATEETYPGKHYRQNRDLLALSILCSELGEVPND